MSSKSSSISVSVKERKFIKKSLEDRIFELQYLIDIKGTIEDKHYWKDELNFCNNFLKKVNKKLEYIDGKNI